MPARPSSLLSVTAVLLFASVGVVHADSINIADVLLVNGSSDTVPNEGRVEVKLNDSSAWLPVCGAGWNFDAGQVVCRQLGYPGTAMVKNASEYEEAQNGLMDLKCTGGEASLQDCVSVNNTTNGTCSDNSTARVVCAGPGYRGCLNTRNNKNDIFKALLNIDNITIQKCLEHAMSARPDNTTVEYVGLQRSRCWFGRRAPLNFTANRTNDSECNYECHGDPIQICGGHRRVSVYSVQDSFCDKPNVKNGVADAEPILGSFYFGTNVNFTCNDGFSTVQCVGTNSSPDGYGPGVNWTNIAPECNGAEPQVTSTTPDCEEADNCATTPSQATNDVALILSILNTVILFLLIIAILIGVYCCCKRKTKRSPPVPARYTRTDSLERIGGDGHEALNSPPRPEQEVASPSPIPEYTMVNKNLKPEAPDPEQRVASRSPIPEYTMVNKNHKPKSPGTNSGFEMGERPRRPKSSNPGPGRRRQPRPRVDQNEEVWGTIIVNPQSQSVRATWPQTEAQDEEGWAENLNYDSVDLSYVNV